MHSLIWGIIWSLLPVSELRGGIPVALANGVNPFLAYFACVFANLLVVPIVFLFLNTAHIILMKINIYKSTFNNFLKNVHRKTHKKVEKYGFLGLTLFVMIPLPITGAYTGTIAAWLFGMKKTKAFNVQIWCGLRVQYWETKLHTLDDAREIIDAWIEEVKDCVTLTPTEYRYVDGMEPGFIVGWIQYPRFPRDEEEIKNRAIDLAERLMEGLEQNRVTVTTPKESIMLEQ